MSDKVANAMTNAMTDLKRNFNLGICQDVPEYELIKIRCFRRALLNPAQTFILVRNAYTVHDLVESYPDG